MIVDDEPKARNLVRTFLTRYFSDRITIIAEADTVESALSALHTTHPQLLFLDIDLNNGMGFEVLDLLGEDRKKVHVVFVTAFPEHLHRAMRYDAVDYILKPIIPTEFKIGVERGIEFVLERAALESQLMQNRRTLTLTVRHSSGAADTVVLSEVVCCRADDNYTNVLLVDGRKIVASKTLKYYENLLSNHGFVRVSRSLLINALHCELQADTKNGVTILMPDGSHEHIDPSLTEATKQALWHSLE